MNSILLDILVCGYLLTFLLWTSYAIKQFKINNSKECASMESMFRILYKKTLTECIYECDVRPKCKAVNYRKRRLQCDLLELPLGTPSLFVPNSDQTGQCVYIHRSNIYMNSSDCCENKCKIGQVCNTDAGECIIKECHPLSVKDAKIFGNMYQVGSRLKIKCNDGYEAVGDNIYTTCNTSGQWDPPVSCQTTECTHEYGSPVSVCTNPDIMTIWVYRNELSQPNAAGACSSIGGKLVKIDTLLKQEFIRNVLKTEKEFLDKDYWIDGSNDYADKAWRFADGTAVPMTNGDFWQRGVPDDPGVECVRMREDAHHLWNDRTCSTTYGYICEIP